MKKCSLCRR